MVSPTAVVVDDDAIFRYALVRLLETVCTIVAEATDGVEAVSAVEHLRPDIVLMDISMPRMNGFQACARIRALHPSIRVVFVSAHSERVYVEEAERLGADDFIPKGRTSTDLLPAVKRLFEMA
jgi:CheY-like chemotaxis protein